MTGRRADAYKAEILTIDKNGNVRCPYIGNSTRKAIYGCGKEHQLKCVCAKKITKISVHCVYRNANNIPVRKKGEKE